MSYRVAISELAQLGIERHKRSGNKKLVEKIFKLFVEISEHPRSGTGQVEQLKGYADREVWSRRIDKKHRLIYEVKEAELVVIAGTIKNIV
ncbi:MAG: Txe/YoeB family addiction module toxin [Rikenellaceae bacterium]